LRNAALISFTCILLCGCNSDLPAQSFIDKLRVLAVRTEPPEVPPGTATTADVLAVEPVISKFDAGPSSVQAFWVACSQPPGALAPTPCGIAPDAGIPPLCSDTPGAPLCVIGAGMSVSYTPDASFVGSDGTGEVVLTAVVSDLAGGAQQCLLDIQANGGLPKYPDRCVVAFKRLSVNANAGATLNTNPTLTAFTITPKGGAPASLTDGSATFPPGSDKTQPQLTLDATRADDASEMDSSGNYEALTVSWFTSSGKISDGRSIYTPPGCATPTDCPKKAPAADATTKWNVPKPEQLATTTDATQTVNFWAVIRDDRGGVGWLSGTATPSPAP
jgi:hypothetical protein